MALMLAGYLTLFAVSCFFPRIPTPAGIIVVVIR
jgi:hypothetical protein